MVNAHTLHTYSNVRVLGLSGTQDTWAILLLTLMSYVTSGEVTKTMECKMLSCKCNTWIWWALRALPFLEILSGLHSHSWLITAVANTAAVLGQYWHVEFNQVGVVLCSVLLPSFLATFPGDALPFHPRYHTVIKSIKLPCLHCHNNLLGLPAPLLSR